MIDKIIFISLITFSYVLQADNKTPIIHSDFHGEVNLDDAEPWIAPDYTQQEKTLGYEISGFSVPAGLEERVAFWLDIYTKYSTDQGLLHDSRYVHLVYEPIDFTEIMNQPQLDRKIKSKMRRKLVDEAKTRIRERLKRLDQLSSPVGLEGEDLRYWYMFAKIDEKNKFKEAAKDGRLRFQLGQKNRFLEGIYHSGRYIKEMESIFKEHHLPIELTRLPFVESSFNLNARSRVGASGVWQFMRSTGKQYMKIDGVVDERNDPLKATEAAAQKMKKNFHMLGNWPLAVTAYNHGPYGMRRLVNKFKTDNLVEIVDIRKGSFGFASASFYASFLAALEAEKRAEKYFGVVFREKPMSSKRIQINKSFSSKQLIKLFNDNQEMADKYNPHLRSYFWKGYRNLNKGHYISVPEINYDHYLANFKSTEPLKMVPVKGENYQIVKGDTLSQIAENFNISLKILMEANGIDNPRRIRVGQKLVIPQ
ncbi:MAG: transglycosylase SLT domain-containing protein [Bdellovibrionales bacterium]|nr:transglycosylase SLT domain-containing protein [Bdellovibrionales bacterium]